MSLETFPCVVNKLLKCPVNSPHYHKTFSSAVAGTSKTHFTFAYIAGFIYTTVTMQRVFYLLQVNLLNLLICFCVFSEVYSEGYGKTIGTALAKIFFSACILLSIPFVIGEIALRVEKDLRVLLRVRWSHRHLSM